MTHVIEDGSWNRRVEALITEARTRRDDSLIDALQQHLHEARLAVWEVETNRSALEAANAATAAFDARFARKELAGWERERADLEAAIVEQAIALASLGNFDEQRFSLLIAAGAALKTLREQPKAKRRRVAESASSGAHAQAFARIKRERGR